MSHILEFSITGLAGREGVYAQTLDRHVNVFFGPNGSGKTSLLKILHSAMSDDSGILETVPFQSAEVRLYSVDFKREFTCTIDKKVRTLTKRTRSEVGESEIPDRYPAWFDASRILHDTTTSKRTSLPDWHEEPSVKTKHGGGWRHVYLPTSRLYLGLSTMERTIVRSGLGELSEEILDQYYAETLQILWRDYYSDILAAIRDAQEDGLASILKAVLAGKKESAEHLREVDLEIAYHRLSTFLERQGSRSILGPLEDFKQRYKENAQLRSVVSDVSEIEKRIAEVAAPRAILESLIRSMFAGNKEVRLEDQSIDVVARNQERIGLSSLSSGEKHVLRIFIEALLAGASSILIDEPEISMHVDWQRDLVRTMQQLNPSAQIIMATHSPEIMADVSDDNIFRL